MATRHSTRGGLSLMSETEISHNPEGHPPEPTGGSSSSAPEAPRAAPRPKPKIGDTRPAPVVAAPPPPEVDAPVVPLRRSEAAAPREAAAAASRGGAADDSGPAESDDESAAKRARSRRRT